MNEWQELGRRIAIANVAFLGHRSGGSHLGFPDGRKSSLLFRLAMNTDLETGHH